MGGIYLIKSRVRPERCYVGSAVNFRQRRYCHLSQLRNNKHHSPKLQNHFNKYGEGDLIFVELMPCPSSELIVIEQFYIDALDPWFNTAPRAGSLLGYKHRDETKRKLSEMKTGTGNHFYGRRHTDDAKARISKSKKEMIGEKNHMYGKHLSEQTKEKLAAPKRGIPIADDVKKKISDALKGRVFSEEHKRKISEGQKGRVSLNKGTTLSEERKAEIYTDEVRQRMSKIRRDKNIPSPKHVEVIDITTGIVFYSIAEAAHALNMDYNILRYSLQIGERNKTVIRRLYDMG